MAAILVTDDEESNLRLIKALLVSLGHEVRTAHSGQECLGIAEQAAPDVILLDATMPGMDGLEAARRLKQSEATSLIPVVMLTTAQDARLRGAALEAGVTDFLAKPVDGIELRARVDSLAKVKVYNEGMRTFNAHMESEIARRTRQLELACKQSKAAAMETIYRLVRAAEFKDEDTGNHVRRMSRYSAAIAKQFGMDEQQTEDILYAAPMHDIGKIGIPDDILLKEGPLNEDEWAIMKQHPIIGACILEDSTVPAVDLGRIIAVTHHEKWDGSGYPQGLRGDEIPLVGRVVALADVFDALTTKRPYKAPFPIEKAFSIIQEGADAHFDPEVVNAFFGATEEILSIRDKFSSVG